MAKQMDRKKSTTKKASQDQPSPVLCIVVAVFACLLATIFVSMRNDCVPIERHDAVSVNGLFDSYESSKNYCYINLQDGSYYQVDARSETTAVKKSMKNLFPGTPVSILINPNTEYVIEVIAQGETLLDFNKSQEATWRNAVAFFGLGIVVYVLAAFVGIYGIVNIVKKK